jgi:hypothetical protein
MGAPTPARLFLDTNVYILGAIDPASAEARILEWVGFGAQRADAPEVVVSAELVLQILRVAKRLRNKDWAGELIMRLWADLRFHYVLFDYEEGLDIPELESVPREDRSIFLTATLGEAEVFVSANHVLLQALLAKTGRTIYLNPDEFVKSYLV